MIKNIEQLKKERPDLVESFESMSREQLVNQLYLECVDALNMEERVQVFMNECTDNMSKTTYTIQAIRDLIEQKREKDRQEWLEQEREELRQGIVEGTVVLCASTPDEASEEWNKLIQESKVKIVGLI